MRPVSYLPLLLTLVFASLLQGCEPPQKTVLPTQKVLVYCDFTSSLSTESAAEIKRFGQWILRSVPRPAEVNFYEISRVSKAPFFQVQKEGMPDKLRDWEIKIWEENQQKILEQKISEFDSEVNQLRIAYEENPAYKGANSCMTNAIMQAHNYFQTAGPVAPEEERRFVVLISDMIEECGNSIFGSLYMNTRDRSTPEDKFRSLSEQIAGSTASPTDFGAIRPIVLQITRQDQNNAMALDPNDFQNLWKQIYLKLGFSEQALTRWNFSPQAPPEGIWN